MRAHDLMFVIAGWVILATSTVHGETVGQSAPSNPSHFRATPHHAGTMHAGTMPRVAPPPYVTLQAPRKGLLYTSAVPRYAYGWFGAQPRSHCVRHFGYHRNFTQWTAR